jgi:hypothetical protein
MGRGRRWRPEIEVLEERCVPATIFTVTTVIDNGNNSTPTAGSLRAAVVGANALAAGSSAIIQFNIGGGGVQIIKPPFPLPALTNPTTIDGPSQPGYAGTPLIDLDGGLISGVGIGIEASGGSAVISGLVFTNWSGAGITLDGAGNNLVTGNYIGVDATGTNLDPNQDGIDISSGGNTIGGTTPGAGNLITGNGLDGIHIAGDFLFGNLVEGNLIGTDPTGLQGLGNGDNGIEIEAAGTTIGGTTAAARNVIVSSEADGIMAQGFAAGGTLIEGNDIGVAADGVTALGNGGAGIDLTTNSSSTTIGGTAAGAGNVIGGNFQEQIILDSLFNTIEGNFIGTDRTGTYNLGQSPFPASPGILVTANGVGSVIGDGVPGAGNVIAFSQGPAIDVTAPGVYGVSIRGNSMFLNAGGGIVLASGANEDATPPVISQFTVSDGFPSITYSFSPDLTRQSPPFVVDFYLRDPATPFGSPQGETYLGTDDNPDGGTQTFTENTIPIPAGGEVVATVTDADHDTSAFSAPALQSGSVYEWTGLANPDSSWTNPANWTLLTGPGNTPSYPQGAGDVAIFDQTTSQLTPTIPNGVNILVGEIDFGSTSPYTIQAAGTGTLTFATGGAAAHVIDTSPHGAQTISAPIVLATSLDVSNTSTNSLVLSGSITETPSTVLTNVNGGFVSFAGATVVVPAGQTFTLNNPIPNSSADVAANVTLASGSSLEVNGAIGSTVTLSGIISGPGNFIKLGPGKVLIPVSTENTYSGATAVRAGELEVDDDQPFSPVYVTGSGLLTGHGLVGSITTGSAPSDLPALRPQQAVLLSVNSVTENLNAAGPTPFDFTVSLSEASSSAVSVSYATSSAPSGSLPAGTQPAPTTDFDVTSGTITIAAGQTSATVQISAYADSTGGPQAFQIVLSNATGASIGQGTGLGTIDPPLPTVSVESTAAPVSASGTTTLSFPVTLSAASSSAITVNYTLSSYPSATLYPVPTLSGVTSASVSALTTATTGVLTIPANSSGATISIPVSVASNITSAQAYALTLSSPSNAVVTSATDEAVGLVTPGSLPIVSVSPAYVLAGRTTTTTMTFTITLSSALTSPLTVNWKTVDQTLSFFSSNGPIAAKSVTSIRGQTTDYKGVSSGSVTFAAGATSQTVSVTVNASTNFVEFGKYFDVQLSLPSTSTSLATLGVSTALGTIFYPTAQQTDGIQPDPNDFPAVLNSEGSVTLDPSAYLNILIDGNTLGTGSGFSGYSQLNVFPGSQSVPNTVNLGGAQLNVIINPDTYTHTPGTQFIIVNNQGPDAVIGTFAGLPEGAIFEADEDWFQITYQGGDGNDVVLTALPGPVAISGPSTGSTNQPLNFTLSGLTSGSYMVNWGDGSQTQTVNGTGNQPVSHSFTSTGPFTVQVWSVVNGVAGVVTSSQVTISAVTVTVTGESVAWGAAGSVALQTASDGLRLLPAGRKTDLPWVGISRIGITLSGAATLSPSDVSVTGVIVANYGPVTIRGSGTNYTITLARPIAAADRLTITIGNASITTFTRRLDVLPGDVNDDGVVNITDGGLILTNVTPQHAYQAIYDLNGDGAVTTADYTLERTFNGTTLSSVPPQLAAGGEGPGGVPLLTAAELAPVLAAAVSDWAAAGLPAADVARLNGVTAQVADLAPAYLGAAGIGSSTIYLSADAAGYGWSLDPAAPPAPGREDLLTVVMHEMGHTLGLNDLDPSQSPADLMTETLPTGVRRLPSAADVDAVLAADAVPQPPATVPGAPPASVSALVAALLSPPAAGWAWPAASAPGAPVAAAATAPTTPAPAGAAPLPAVALWPPRKDVPSDDGDAP